MTACFSQAVGDVSLMMTTLDASQVGWDETKRAPWRETGTMDSTKKDEPVIHEKEVVVPLIPHTRRYQPSWNGSE
jgi:hypothetical protein